MRHLARSAAKIKVEGLFLALLPPCQCHFSDSIAEQCRYSSKTNHMWMNKLKYHHTWIPQGQVSCDTCRVMVREAVCDAAFTGRKGQMLEKKKTAWSFNSTVDVQKPSFILFLHIETLNWLHSLPSKVKSSLCQRPWKGFILITSLLNYRNSSCVGIEDSAPHQLSWVRQRLVSSLGPITTHNLTDVPSPLKTIFAFFVCLFVLTSLNGPVPEYLTDQINLYQLSKALRSANQMVLDAPWSTLDFCCCCLQNLELHIVAASWKKTI